MSVSIDSYQLGVFEGWAVWMPGQAASQVTSFAAQMGSNPAAQAQVRAAVQAHEAGLNYPWTDIQVGLWVPDPATGQAAATFALEFFKGDPRHMHTAASYHRTVARLGRRRGMRILEYGLDVGGSLAAGPAVFQVIELQDKRTRARTTEIVYSVFPPNAHDWVRCTFRTPTPDLFEALSDEANDILSSLVLPLCPEGT